MQIGTVPYKGKVLPIIVEPKQWRDIRIVSGKEVRVNSKTGASAQELFMPRYNALVKSELQSIVKKALPKFLNKKIRYEVLYTNGTKKVQKLSAKEWASMLGIETIKHVIGSYDSEWGINQIDNKKREFILHFNLNLIKFDSGDKINYVVAHEVAHVFERGHDKAFEKVLQQLYPRSKQSEKFWNKDYARKL